MTPLTIPYTQHQQEISQLSEKFETEIKHLKEQLEWFKRQLFGPKAEKLVDHSKGQQLYFEGFDKLVSEPVTKPIAAHERQKRTPTGKDTITLPADIPVEKVFLDIPEEKKICSETGLPLVKIGEEVTQKLAHKPGSYYVKEIIRPKYALPKGSEGGICVADLPETLLTRCEADESFLAELLVKKYGDHLPLYRQSEILTREGINISRQILSKWVLRAGHALKPLYEEMKKQILLSENVFLDETPIKMLDTGYGEDGQGYMWVLSGGESVNPCYRIYDFRTNRRHDNARDILKDYRGVLHSDKYGAYEALANQKQLTWCPCWAHIRRKFFEAESGDPPFRSWVLRHIRYLFMLEKVAWARSEKDRLYIRQEKEVPIIDKLITAIKERLVQGKILPKSKFKEAIGYFMGLIPYLKNYTKHAWARLDNNVAERAIRPIAIGRKNWLFVGNEDSGEAAGVILSLIQTCRAAKINPRVYLEDVMRRLMSHRATKLVELLPDHWASARLL